MKKNNIITFLMILSAMSVLGLASYSGAMGRNPEDSRAEEVNKSDSRDYNSVYVSTPAESTGIQISTEPSVPKSHENRKNYKY